MLTMDAEASRPAGDSFHMEQTTFVRFPGSSHFSQICIVVDYNRLPTIVYIFSVYAVVVFAGFIRTFVTLRLQCLRESRSDLGNAHCGTRVSVVFPVCR